MVVTFIKNKLTKLLNYTYSMLFLKVNHHPNEGYTKGLFLVM